MSGITRRSLLAGAMASAFAGTTLGAAIAGAEETPGDGTSLVSYRGQAEGLKSIVKVAVSLSSSGDIERVDVLECGDSPFISDAAAEIVTGQIVERQSIDVDVASGATWTSMGIMEAVRDALESNGVDASAYKSAVPEMVTGNDVDCDVLVIGGGAAGLSAAIAARTDASMSPGADSGLSVIVVEQLAYTGGCIRVSDCMLLTINGTRYNAAVGSESPTDDLIAYTKDHDTKGYLNEPLFRNVLDSAPTALQALLDRGLYMPVSDAQPVIEGVCGLPAASWSVHDPVTGENSSSKPDEHGWTYGSNCGGPYLAQSLLYAAKEAGVDVRTSTKVVKLIVEGSAVTGVRVQDKIGHTEYVIHPKRIILASGCLGADPERMEKWAPSAAGAVHFGCAGTTGDGIAWIEEAGGVVLDGKVHYQPGPDGRVGHYGLTAILENYAPCIMVNIDGKRFFNEKTRSRAVANTTYIAQPDNKVFGIVSGTAIEEFRECLDYAVERHVGWKADDLNSLAEQAGIDPSGLAETVEQYRSAYDAGEGAEFETDHDSMIEIAQSGPYYAFLMRTLYNLADIGIKVNEDFVPVTQDGTVIYDNMCAAGSIIVSNYSFMTGGFSHMMALTSGVVVGNVVRDELSAVA